MDATEQGLKERTVQHATKLEILVAVGKANYMATANVTHRAWNTIMNKGVKGLDTIHRVELTIRQGFKY